jgi:hypothetical protein
VSGSITTPTIIRSDMYGGGSLTSTAVQKFDDVSLGGLLGR